MTASFTWSRDSIAFVASVRGVVVKRAVINRHVPAGNENPRVNLWCMADDLAGDGTTEVVIKAFHFAPLK
ncbi:MAG: hypothetical protein M3081_15245 [Gemmatimonadota bacterium]|nr:hypothetical protein [Gemmatimonadota bacterium]